MSLHASLNHFCMRNISRQSDKMHENQIWCGLRGSWVWGLLTINRKENNYLGLVFSESASSQIHIKVIKSCILPHSLERILKYSGWLYQKKKSALPLQEVVPHDDFGCFYLLPRGEKPKRDECTTRWATWNSYMCSGWFCRQEMNSWTNLPS